MSVRRLAQIADLAGQSLLWWRLFLNLLVFPSQTVKSGFLRVSNATDPLLDRTIRRALGLSVSWAGRNV